MTAINKHEYRLFEGQRLPLVDIREVEVRNPGAMVLFEVVRGDGWHNFRYGYQIAQGGTGQFTQVIKAYHRAYPGAKLYLSGRDIR